MHNRFTAYLILLKMFFFFIQQSFILDRYLLGIYISMVRYIHMFLKYVLIYHQLASLVSCPILKIYLLTSYMNLILCSKQYIQQWQRGQSGRVGLEWSQVVCMIGYYYMFCLSRVRFQEGANIFCKCNFLLRVTFLNGYLFEWEYIFKWIYQIHIYSQSSIIYFNSLLFINKDPHYFYTWELYLIQFL